jgi:hypothetical protein
MTRVRLKDGWGIARNTVDGKPVLYIDRLWATRGEAARELADLLAPYPPWSEWWYRLFLAEVLGLRVTRGVPHAVPVGRGVHGPNRA